MLRIVLGDFVSGPIAFGTQALLEDEGWTVYPHWSLPRDSGGDDVEPVDLTPPADVVFVMVPGGDGQALDWCRRARQRTTALVVVGCLSADDLPAAMEAGADDVVVLPSSAVELTGRIRAGVNRIAARRPAVAAELEHRSDRQISLEIDVDACSVRLNGDEVSLTRTEFLLLSELASRPGKVISRETLLSVVWGYETADPRLVDSHVWRLRRKLDDATDGCCPISTVRGFGYKLLSPGDDSKPTDAENLRMLRWTSAPE